MRKKRIKLAPGVRVNTGKRGITSVSVAGFNFKTGGGRNSSPSGDGDSSGCLVLAILGLALLPLGCCLGFCVLSSISQVDESAKQVAKKDDKKPILNMEVQKGSELPDSKLATTPEAKTETPNRQNDKVDDLSEAKGNSEKTEGAVGNKNPIPKKHFKFRQWVSAKGQYKIEAKIVSFDNGQVSLEKSDGIVIKAKAAKLSNADQLYIVKNTGWGRIWQLKDGN